MFFKKSTTLVFIICFASAAIFAQVKPVLQKFEMYQNDTINGISTDGLKQGKWIYFGKDKKEETYSKFKKNQIIEEGFYLDNKKKGLWKYYYENGNTKSEITYLNDRPKGVVKLYNTDGKLKEGGTFENNDWVGEHYIVDDKGNKIPHPANEPNTFLQFSGRTSKLGKSVEGVKILVIENQVEEREFITSKDGSFSIPLYLNDEFSINFSKPGFHPQTILVNTNIFSAPDVIYYLKDWVVNLSDNMTTAATNDVLGLLLNKPSNKINFNKKKKQFSADGEYIHLFKKQAKLIGKTGEKLLSAAMQENKRLEIENLKAVAGNREKEIELLRKNKEIQDAALYKNQEELSKQKLEAEKKEQELTVQDQERQIRKLKRQKELEDITMKRKLEIEHLTHAKKLQELELELSKAQLNKTTSDLTVKTSELNTTSVELRQQIREAVLKENKIVMLSQEKAADERARQQDTIIKTGLTVGLVIVFVLIFFLYRNFLNKAKANNVLKQQAVEINFQKQVVEEKNKDITDSISYAKLIQEAILPSKELKFKLFKDVFMLYKPKDIVSGDFYWYTERNGKKIIAAVDCTGHGVPGAFMSMIGNSFLNEIINEKGTTKPSEILDLLRDNVIFSLKQKESENKDGMDISIICFDEKNNTVEFAGANNPLWYIRDGKMNEIKGDKQPIGLYHWDSKPFTNHKIELQKGDVLFIFTDGYADQFGGQEGKKFKYKPLQELLLANSDKPMHDHKMILNKAFESWRGGLDQVDDVLIIGIRV